MQKPPVRKMPNSNHAESELASELAALDARRNKILDKLGTQGTVAVVAPRLPLWILIQNYLQFRGGTSTYDAILKAMIEAGHNLGKYPARTVTACLVSPALANIFAVRKNKQHAITSVSLKSMRVLYVPQEHRQQAKAAAAGAGKH